MINLIIINHQIDGRLLQGPGAGRGLPLVLRGLRVQDDVLALPQHAADHAAGGKGTLHSSWKSHP